MFQKNSFSVVAAREILASIKGNVEYPESGNITDINNALEKVIFGLNVHKDAPNYVLTRALYDNGDGETLQSARFVVRPAVRDALEVDDLKKVFVVTAGPDFFDKFIDDMAEWFDMYQYYKQLQTNVDELNTIVAEAIEENEIPFDIKFSFGDGLVDASDNHAVVGLPAEVIEDLSTLPLFDTDMESRVEGYKSRLVDTLKECTKAYDIVKVKSSVTKDLDIYSRKALHKLIRQFVNRKIDFVRTGTGYVDTDEYFAVIDKVAVTEAELAELDVTDALVIDNEGASAKEKEAGKTKIVVSYRISPFIKKDGVPTEVKLSEVI